MISERFAFSEFYLYLESNNNCSFFIQILISLDLVTWPNTILFLRVQRYLYETSTKNEIFNVVCVIKKKMNRKFQSQLQYQIFT